MIIIIMMSYYAEIVLEMVRMVPKTRKNVQSIKRFKSNKCIKKIRALAPPKSRNNSVGRVSGC